MPQPSSSEAPLKMKSWKPTLLAIIAFIAVSATHAFAQVSLRGIYTASINTSLTAVIAVHDDNNLDAFLFDTGQQLVGKTATTIDPSGAFTIANELGYGINGTLSATGASATIAGSVTSASFSAPVPFSAPRTVWFGVNNSDGSSVINGRFIGKAFNETGGKGTNLTLIVDANDNLYLVHEVSPGVFAGGIGVVTPNSDDTGGSFTFTSVKGHPGSGTFTTNAFTMSGTLAYETGTFDFTVFRDAAANRLGNISTRGFVGTGQNVLIGGFVITGGPKLVLIRVLGPGLANYGITQPIPDPTVTLYSGQKVLVSNTGWQNQSSPSLVTEIQATHLAPPDSGDDAILVQLEPGAYSTVVTGASGDTGTGLVEIYEVLLD
jgi:hypothetical protein